MNDLISSIQSAKVIQLEIAKKIWGSVHNNWFFWGKIDRGIFLLHFLITCDAGFCLVYRDQSLSVAKDRQEFDPCFKGY